jgi:uncharacterized protein YjiS (DUF1127 family)
MPTTFDGHRETGADAARTTLPSSAQAVGWVINLIVGWEERSRQRHQLSVMDDRMLRDIGLDRHRAQGEYLKPFWRL